MADTREIIVVNCGQRRNGHDKPTTYNRQRSVRQSGKSDDGKVGAFVGGALVGAGLLLFIAALSSDK